MTRFPRLMPTNPRLFSAHVVRSVRTSPSFQRVTISGDDLGQFEWSGDDHWFRLFLPPSVGAPLKLPAVSGRAWYKPYLAIPEGERPHCSNYTVADFRAAGAESSGAGADSFAADAAVTPNIRSSTALAELDIDVVLHGDAVGEIDGRVAIWATSTRAGAEVALLDQGPLFDLPADVRGVHLIADETGLPALRGILRNLDERMIGTAIIEVPLEGDIEPLEAPPGIHVRWVARAHTVDDASAVPGAAALAAIKEHAVPEPDDYAFIVGESSLAAEGRRALHRAGLPKSRITFSGYWKHTPH